MPYARVPFADRQASGLEELAGQSPIAFNVLMEQSGAVRRRPGLRDSSLASSENLALSTDPDKMVVSGLYLTLDDKLYAAVDNGASKELYYVTATGALRMSASGSLTALMGSDRPQFAETEMLLVMAAGREMQKVELATNSSSRLGGTPPSATHVLPMASRLLANDNVVDRTKVRYSDLAQGTTTFAGHEVWTTGVGTAGFFTAEAQPDPVVALGSSTNELFVFGSRTLQLYSSDPVLVFAPVSTIEIGCGAPYSPVKVDQKYFLLDDKRRFVQTDGRTYEVISGPIRKTLESIAEVSDGFGYRVLIGQYDCLVWTFPTDGRTFVYQIGSGWSQWSAPASANQIHGPFVVRSHALHGSGVNLVGQSIGNIQELSLDANTDSGGTIPAYVETGYINRETDARKQCKCLRFSLLRGETTGGEAPVAYFGWRDQPGAWDARLPIDIGDTGDTEIVVQFHSLGVYRRRQWFFEFSGTDELVLVSATETFEVIEDTED